MGSFGGKVRTIISLSSIVHNYKAVSKATRGSVLPVVKADAYGHGLPEVAGALGAAGARSFAVGTVEEAVSLRESSPTCGIYSMLGPVEPHEYPALWEYGVTGFIHCFDQLERISELARARRAPLDIVLKFDTGMRRLGFTLKDVPEIARRLRRMDTVNLKMITSHFSTADDPEAHGHASMQTGRFKAIRAALLERGFDFRSSISNSAASLVFPELTYGVKRIGIMLYGVNPLRGTRCENLCHDLKPAMSAKSVIIARHELKAGEAISYGCAFEAPHDMAVAIVAAGYGDGYSRNLTNRGEMLVHGRRAKIVGRVCLQMTAIDVTDIHDARVGDPATLLGPDGRDEICIYELSGWWKSIPADVMQSFSNNRREYVHAKEC